MLNWSDIDTVLLDMDGTLLDLSYDNFFWNHYLPEKYAQHHNLELNSARTFLEEKSANLKGSLNWYCVDYWSESLDLDIESLKADISHKICFREQAPEFLSFLKQMNKQIILVTNAHPKSLQLKAKAVGLNQYIDRMLSSHDFSLAKENTGFWPLLSSQENINLERSLFIDDSLAVLNCAHREGVKHLIHILQPDSNLAPVSQSNFYGIIHFNEIMAVT